MGEGDGLWKFVERVWNWRKIGDEGIFWSFTRKWERVVMLRVCFIYASLNNRCRSLVGVLEELGGG